MGVWVGLNDEMMRRRNFSSGQLCSSLLCSVSGFGESRYGGSGKLVLVCSNWFPGLFQLSAVDAIGGGRRSQIPCSCLLITCLLSVGWGSVSGL